jgi:hypothetical protein
MLTRMFAMDARGERMIGLAPIDLDMGPKNEVGFFGLFSGCDSPN